MLRALKIVVSLGLLTYLLFAVDWAGAAAVLRQAQAGLLGIAGAIYLIQLILSAWKWQIALLIHDVPWRVATLFRFLVMGMFFNSFLPTAVGGDIYRAYRTLPGHAEKSRAISAVILERVVGLLALLAVGAVGAAVIFARDRDPTIGLLALVLAAPPILGASLPGLVRLGPVRRLLRKLGSIPKLEPLERNGRSILADKRGLARLAGVSLLFQALAPLAIAVLFAAVRTHDILAESAVISAIYSASSLIPISINGLGIMEGSFAFTAQQLGVSFDSAVIVSLMVRLVSTLISVAGGVIFFFDKGRAAGLAAARGTEAAAD